MIDAEKRFKELRQRIDVLDTSSIHSNIENNLRQAWQKNDEGSQSKGTWNIWAYILSGSSVVALAVITTLTFTPIVTPETKKSKTPAVMDDEGVAYPLQKIDDLTTTANSLGSGAESKINYDSIEQPVTQYGYQEEGATNQLFSESVSLSVQIQEDMLGIIHRLREQIDTNHGYLLNITYYSEQATIQAKIPVDQLADFEEVLKNWDVNHKLEIGNYNVTNVSKQVVAIDERIQATQQRIDENKAKLNVGNLTERQKQEIQTELTADEEYLTTQNTERAEAIEKYNLVDVSITVRSYSSFLEGDYTQYDRSTFSGLFKYELSKTIHSLIRSAGKIISFCLWLIVYSLLLIPSVLIIKSFIRKIKSRKAAK